MQKFIDVSEILCTKAIKKICEYNKENLQEPANKKEIVCDENHKSIFAGRECVGFDVFVETLKRITTVVATPLAARLSHTQDARSKGTGRKEL